MAFPPHHSPPEDDGPTPVDPRLIDQALTRIRKQVQGNGLKPADVVLNGAQGQVFEFFGTTSWLLTPKITTARRLGRLSDGHMIGAGQLDAALSDFLGKTAADRHVLGLLQGSVLSRRDQGFGLQDEHIALPQIQKTFIMHEACNSCHGTGGKPCLSCHTTGRITCYRCHGTGGVTCITCSGRGQIITPQGPMPCHACVGRGQTACTVCQGHRAINCPECQGQGKKICESCGGHGWFTQSWTVALAAQSHFRMQTRGLPATLTQLIKRVGAARLAADGHATVNVLLERDAIQFMKHADIAPNASLWYLYRARMPFAVLDITIGKHSIKPAIAGYKGRMVDVPPFMDDMLRTPLRLLTEAQTDGIHAPALLMDAAKYRAAGDVLRGLLRSTKKHTGKSLMDAYPVGLSQDFAKKFLSAAHIALSKLSLWPRLAAMGGAMAVSACLFALSSFIHLPTTVLETIGLHGFGIWGVVGFNIAMMAILGMAGTHAIRLAARNKMVNILEGLGIPPVGHTSLPRPGTPGLWLWLALFAMVTASAFFT